MSETTKATHTPGPWKWEPIGHEDCDDFTRDTPVYSHEPYAAKTLVAKVECWGSVSERNANARLIAAAPELLEACEIIRDSLGIRDDFAPLGTLEFAPQLMAAIAKARGESLTPTNQKQE